MCAQQPTILSPDLHVQNQPALGFKPVLYSIRKVYVLLVGCLERIRALMTQVSFLLTIISFLHFYHYLFDALQYKILFGEFRTRPLSHSLIMLHSAVGGQAFQTHP